MQLQELQELARLRRPVYGISKLPGCSTLDTADSALRWSQLKCTTGTVLADGHGKLGDILVGESSQATISPKLNPGLNSNPWVVTNKVAKATHTDKVVHLSKEYNCQTNNLVYLVQCKKCKDQYIGETKHTLEHRFNQHLGYVRRKETDKATGDHFNKKGHQISDMTITVLEGINSDDPFYRLQREHFWIEQFNVLHKGMNGKR